MSFKETSLARFWELKNAIDAIEAQTAPLRTARDAFVNAAARRDEALMEEIRAVEAQTVGGSNLFDARQELAFLARGLGNVGENPTPPE